MTRCVFTKFPGGQCPKDATRRVDARALGKPADGLDVCDEHYAFIKEYWAMQATNPKVSERRP